MEGGGSMGVLVCGHGKGETDKVKQPGYVHYLRSVEVSRMPQPDPWR